MEKKISQSELARHFGRSQNWVSKQQRLSADPMPKDLAGALAWGVRNKHLADPAAPGEAPDFPLLQASAAGASPLTQADLALKLAREEKIRAELESMTGALMPKAEVEQRELLIAAEFRRAACDYPLRARAVLDRHLHDAEVIGRIIADLEPLAAELLNRADPRQVLKGKSPGEIRVILLAHVEEVVQACS